MDPNANHVLSQFELPSILRHETLGSAGGFSGARLWKICCESESFCLRRWPASHPDSEQLSWMHRVIRHAGHNECPFVASPVSTRSGETFVRYDQTHWELSRWMPGVANFNDDPNSNRLTNMMQALARFHLAAAQVSFDFRVSSNLQSRLKLLSDVDSVRNRIANSRPAKIQFDNDGLGRFRKRVLLNCVALSKSIGNQLESFAQNVFPVQPVIRDVWHDHILFTGDEVSGLVDFGAMQIDNVVFDISRLLGSTIGDNPDRWSSAIEAYRQLRPLSEADIRLTHLLDRTSVLLGSLNWLQWIYVDGRTFENVELVMKRIDWLNHRTLWDA